MPTIKERLLTAKVIFKDTPFPELPKDILEIKKLFQKHEFPPVDELVAIISNNPNLAGELFALANQPQFLGNRQMQILTIKDAIDVIGTIRLKAMIDAIGFKMVLSINSALHDVLSFTLDVASVASVLSNQVFDVSEDEAYTAGLFHNAGAMLLAARFPGYGRDFLSHLDQPYTTPKIEEIEYGVSHTLAGLLISQKWHLSKALNQVIFSHHQRDLSKIGDDKTRGIVALLQLASAIVIETTYPDQYSQQVEWMYHNAIKELMLEEGFVEASKDLLETVPMDNVG